MQSRIKTSTSNDDADFTYSDERLKHSIIEMPQDVNDRIMHLKPRCFHLSREEKGPQHFGFIAQELEKVFPNLVKQGTNVYDSSTPCTTAYKMVNYIELIPVLLLKIQDLQKQIDILKGSAQNS